MTVLKLIERNKLVNCLCYDKVCFFGYTEVATFLHACEGDAVTKLSNEKIPYFNAPIYLQNKTQIGKVDEIFGPINESVCYLSLSLCCILLLLACSLIS